MLDVSPTRVRAQLRLGLFLCELRFSLAAEPHAAGVTRLGLVVALENEIALAGGRLDRFDVRKLACEVAEQLLGAIVSCAERGAEALANGSGQ